MQVVTTIVICKSECLPAQTQSINGKLFISASILSGYGRGVASCDKLLFNSNTRVNQQPAFAEVAALTIYRPKKYCYFGSAFSYALLNDIIDLDLSLPAYFSSVAAQYPIVFRRQKIGLGVCFGFQNNNWNFRIRAFVSKIMRQFPQADIEERVVTNILSIEGQPGILERSIRYAADEGFNDSYLSFEFMRSIAKDFSIGTYLQIVNLRKPAGPRMLDARYDSYNLEPVIDNIWKPYAEISIRENKMAFGLLLNYNFVLSNKKAEIN